MGCPMEWIEVLQPGLLTTVQDLGRNHYKEFGIPVAGAMDAYALRMANLLAGNPQDAAALEISLVGPKLKFLQKAAVAMTGANLSPQLNGEPVEMWRTFTVAAGDVLAFGARITGCRAYLAVNGGIEVPAVMGSRSTFLRGGYGGLEGRALIKGDVLNRGPGRKWEMNRQLPHPWRPDYKNPRVIRCIPGPQAERFEQAALEAFTQESYQVSTQSDRMGARLNGPALKTKHGADIISDAVVKGAIQVPGNGQPIVLLSDSQVSGGYTKIATILEVDLGYFVQKIPGETVRFAMVTIEEAQKLWCEQEQMFAMMQRING